MELRKQSHYCPWTRVNGREYRGPLLVKDVKGQMGLFMESSLSSVWPHGAAIDRNSGHRPFRDTAQTAWR
ncbi:hypothetical protein [Mycobacterium intracellulare]|uniref:hypothetical protein n=1 Tax=Mycobacterium intracellulare TaxID=1767 RepID=UPI0030C89367